MFAALQAIFSAIVGFFGAKVSAVAAAAAVFASLTAAFALAIDGALDFVVPALPSWAAIGFAMLPEQVPTYIGAYVAALAARRVYDVSISAVMVRV